MVALIRTATFVLFMTTMTGCSTTTFYTSPSSKRDVAECIYKGWEKAPSSGSELPLYITDFTEYYFVGVQMGNPYPTARHPESVVWAEIKDKDGGSSTEYRRTAQIIHKVIDRVVLDCQKVQGGTSLDTFVTSDSTEYASLEGAFIQLEGFANWDDLSVEAVDDRLFIIKPIEDRKSSVVAKVSPGEHDITVRFTYNRNGWPKTGTVRLSAKLSVYGTYKLRSELAGSEYRIELYDKSTGVANSATGKGKGFGVPPPPIFIFPPLFKN